MFAATAFIIALLVALDLWDLCRSRSAGSRTTIESGVSPPAGPPEAKATGKCHTRLGWPAVGFAAAVLVVFLAIELAGNWLAPGPLQILAATRSAATRWLGAAEAERPSATVSAVLGVALFYLAGFYDYVLHRWFSHSRWFWYTHEYHHLPRFVSVLAPGILGKPFAFIPGTLATMATAGTLYAGLALCKMPAWDLGHLIPVLLIILIVLTASHSSFLRRFSIVHSLMRLPFLTSPQDHLLHHAAHLQGNFGNFTTLWDRILGTYLDPRRLSDEEVALGLPYDQDFLGTLTLGRVKLSPGARERFEISRFCNLDESHTGP